MSDHDIVWTDEDALDAARYRYLVRNPDGAQHLFKLLERGKGDDRDLDKMIDRLIASEKHVNQVNASTRTSTGDPNVPR